ncbi:hypothetical protein IL54_1802 [Sphingobium sp. ba1]|nr:hypothetical protein IL54_1802 [Sphingobium sp. ba1]
MDINIAVQFRFANTEWPIRA